LRKTPKTFFLLFWVKFFYTDHIKFHILIVICVLLYFTENALTESIVHRMFFKVKILCPELLNIHKSKNRKKPKKTFSEKPRVFQPCYRGDTRCVTVTSHTLKKLVYKKLLPEIFTEKNAVLSASFLCPHQKLSNTADQ